MRRLVIEPGHRFTRLTIVREVEPVVRGGISQRRFLCRCDCGTEKDIEMGDLTRRRHPTKSCGCYKIDLHTTHGHSVGQRQGKTTPEYRVWAQMIGRCTNPKHISYSNYGRRGIKVCPRWFRFENFIKDMGPRPSGVGSKGRARYWLERVDNERGYGPSNCRWATVSDQRRNDRRNVHLTYNGRTMVQQDWAKELGIDSSVMIGRLRRGWSLERALTTKSTSR